ncbi:serine protease [Thalassospira sp. TSL5-1]|uniref:S1 family peptidase n=1 Tax=Thalassospira sp. TSL5-1 TaxID=1544451 RepID=UPI000939E417|nr:serine protease [Thalassospira sp. TSL5-1]OKH86719.1 hypothetical protein LF95_20135 [Thalassospira sp. TSL5-1]
MARLNFLTVTDTSNWTPVMGSDGAFLAQHAFVRGVLLDIAPDLADLFAEPVYRRQPSGKIESVTWYSQAQGAIKKLNHLDADFRENVLADLSAQISKCVALLNHMDIGQPLAAMLQLGAKDSVMVVGRKPVLINWALHDPNLVDADHFHHSVNALWQDLLGQSDFVIYSEVETDNSDAQFVEAGGASLEKASVPVVIDNIVPDETIDEQSSNDASGSGEPNESDLDLTNNHSFEEPSGTGVLNRGEATIDSAAQQPDRSWQDRLLFWGGWIISAILLILLLFLLWWYFWGQSQGEQASSSSVLDELRAERNRLLELLEDPCAPEAQGYIEQNGPVHPVGVMPAPSGVVSGSAADAGGAQNDAPNVASTEANVDTNTNAEEQQVVTEEDQSETESQGASSNQPKDMTELARAAEKSVVLILSASRNGGAAMGTGFFIGPQFIVTNRHVVEQSRDSSAFVTSEWLGDVKKAKIVAMSPDAEIGNPDFALLKLDAPSAGVPLAVSNRVDKLMRVVAAGYPAFLTQGDPALERLIGGDRNSAPEMVFTTGEVSVVQKHPNKPDIVIHSADISQGNSGGPLMNTCGDVVGVNTFVGQDAQSGRRGLFSISGADLQEFLRENGASFQSAVSQCAVMAGE